MVCTKIFIEHAGTHLIILFQPCSSDSCTGQILKFAIDVAGITPPLVS